MENIVIMSIHRTLKTALLTATLAAMAALGWTGAVDAASKIVDYRLRQPDSKRQAVVALRSLHFDTVAAGDSYNDTAMLAEADHGILFRPPENVVREFPRFPVARSYEELRRACLAAAGQAG